MFSGEAIERVHHASRGIPRLINIVCERTLLIGYVEEEQVLKAPHVDQAVADLNLKPIGDGMEQHTGALGIESTLLLRMAGQLDAIMKKLAELEAAQAASHALRPGSGDAPKIRQWLKSLRQNPLKAPRPGARPNDVPDGEPFDELVDTAVAARSSIKTAKTETNH